jgi:hypothetical protein
MTLDEVAREAIRYTLAAYHLAGDRGRIDELVATFTEDGILELANGTFTGRAAIAERLRQVGARPAQPSSVRMFLHHHLTTSQVEIAGEGEATGYSYFLVMSPVGLDHCGRYADRYRRVGDRWLIARRKTTISWASPDSVIGASAASSTPG